MKRYWTNSAELSSWRTSLTFSSSRSSAPNRSSASAWACVRTRIHIARSGWRTLIPAVLRAARATLMTSSRNVVSASSRSSIRAGSATGQLARWTLSGAPGSRPATRFR